MVQGLMFLEESKDSDRPVWPRASPFPAPSLSFLTCRTELVIVKRSSNHRAGCLALTYCQPRAWTGYPN